MFEEKKEQFLSYWSQNFHRVIEQTPSLSKVLEHHFQAQGKMIRPVLTLAFYDLLCQAKGVPPEDAIYDLAFAIELFHNGTLVHDDLQDQDILRRGQETCWKKFGAYQAINAGSALYLYSLQVLANTSLTAEQKVAIQQLFHSQMVLVVEGQAFEYDLWERIFRESGLEEARKHYYHLVESKTSALFSLPFCSALLLLDKSKNLLLPMQEIAKKLGSLFQLQDDLVDFFGDKGRERVGTDLAEGKPSFLFVASHFLASKERQKRLFEILQKPRDKTTEQDILWSIQLFKELDIPAIVCAEMETIEQELKVLITNIEGFPPDTFHPFFQQLLSLVKRPIQHLL